MKHEYMDLVGALAELANATVQAGVPSDIVIGEVISIGPLRIQLESKLIVDAPFIVLTKNTSDWTMEMTVDHHTENASGGAGEAAFASHNHGYKGRKKYLVHNGLSIGDKVLLLRESGGQRFIALDRVHNVERGYGD